MYRGNCFGCLICSYGFASQISQCYDANAKPPIGKLVIIFFDRNAVFLTLMSSFFMIWQGLAHPSPYVEPPLGQLKLLSRPTDALVRNASTGNLYVLCYRAKLEKLTFNYCNFLSSARPLSKMHFLQVECKSSIVSVRGGSRPSAKVRPNYVMGVWGQRLQWGPEAFPLVRGQRDFRPSEADDIFLFQRLIT